MRYKTNLHTFLLKTTDLIQVKTFAFDLFLRRFCLRTPKLHAL